ncbi:MULTISPECIES: SLATT domain-containing protein [Bacillus]|uniref:SLATT domain-containing protein n=1 Tax=Bacillus TaxID=1386 RepID=UPI001E3724D1|nr:MULTISPECIES: SLATT domain-containing protein [Bacillus]MCY8045754.1 SLATT domain-containing protein [Bacillus haynesii]MCY8080528.1 SLATT domain-containing protein [Bacillus haynesii]MCY8385859.1 SLATT domain-containing protein [Bacillus haynesii]MCY8401467.1 SLATT domain-containing protein [Bacillus haynesii]MCY9152541.1 SLATT domain-containing protein [Bacillus haynesii]
MEKENIHKLLHEVQKELEKSKPRTTQDVFLDLKRRVRFTRKARIKASQRLRNRHEFFEKVSYFYSLLVLIFSVWFLNMGNDVENLTATKVLLIFSLSLTFFTMFLNIKNYKERAGSFELNYQNLDILLNKIERREANPQPIEEHELKGLQREYEKLLLEKENHLDIDYYLSDKKTQEKYAWKIKKHNFIDWVIKVLVLIYPLIIILAIFIYTWFNSWLANNL